MTDKKHTIIIGELRIFPNNEANDRCAAAMFQSLYLYFLGRELSLTDVDKLTKNIPTKGTWAFPAYTELAKNGIEAINIENFDYKKYYEEGDEYIINNFDTKTIELILEKTNLPILRDDIKEFLIYVKHETRKPTKEDVERLLEDGFILSASVNSRVLNDKEGFSPHNVIIVGMDNENYIVNDPGLPARQRYINKTKLLAALDQVGEINAFRHVK